MRRRIDDALAAASALAAQPSQWLHGDYHLGNLLFTRDAVTGVVDFDDCGAGAPAVDLAVALYALARDPTHEPALRFDPALWRAGAAAYGPAGSPWREPDPSPRRSSARTRCSSTSTRRVAGSGRSRPASASTPASTRSAAHEKERQGEQPDGPAAHAPG